MKSIKLSSDLLGYYLPSFFFLKVNTFHKLDNLNNLDEQTLSTLSHEYFHFLQDIFTTYGLLNIVLTVDRLKRANQDIHNSKDETFIIPYSHPLNGKTQLNIDLLSIYEGDSKCRITYNNIVSIERENNDLIVGYENIPLIKINVENTYTGLSDYYYLGHICISESMAYLLERELFEIDNAPRVPYRTVEEVCEFIYPELCNDPLNLIALCDIVLHHSHPALLLVDLLDMMKEHNFIPENASQVYTVGSLYRSNDKSIADIYSQSIDSAIVSLSDYFTVDIYEPAVNWAKSVLTEARKLRQEENFTFLEFVKNKDKGIRRLRRMVSEIGTPLMANKDDNYYCLHPQTKSEQQAPLYKAINEVYSVLFGYQEGCTLKKFCQNSSPTDPTSSLCDSAPWENSYKEDLCNFAQVWKMWGLDKKKAIRHHYTGTGTL